MIDDRFEALLKQVIGLDAASIGAPAVERAVLERCTLWNGGGTCNLDAYWTALNASAHELQMLIEAVVVPETWFFRDGEAFAALARLASERLANPLHLPLRLLSLPCSTGEEPYSMAMALFDAGIAAERFVIDAVDVSDRAVNHAAKAVYSRNSFRGHQSGFRERYFTESMGSWLLDPAVRDAVRFKRANLFDAALFNGGLYDFVFCRNVLIYFDRETQDRAAGVLERLLAPDGALFVGPSETGLLTRHGMASAKIPLAFAFRHAAPATEPPLRVVSPAVVPAQIPPREKARRDSVMPFSRAREAAPRARVQPSAAPGPAPAATQAAEALAYASRIADEGRLAEAAGLTTEHVRLHGPSAQAFYLLGLIADASGRASDAGGWYQKTLYLEPAHQEALTHLGALLEQRGDHAAARLLIERAKRAGAAGSARGE